jgi:hypothetical protein
LEDVKNILTSGLLHLLPLSRMLFSKPRLLAVFHSLSAQIPHLQIRIATKAANPPQLQLYIKEIIRKPDSSREGMLRA